MASFGSQSGPRGNEPPQSSENFPRPSPPSSPYASAGSPSPRSTESPPRWVDGQRSFKYDARTNPRPSMVTSFVASHNSGASTTANVARFQDLKRIESHPFNHMDEEISSNSTQAFLRSPSDLCIGPGNYIVPQRTRSPPLAIRSNDSVENGRPPFGEGQWPTLSPQSRDGRPKLPVNYSTLLSGQVQSSVLPYVGSYSSGRSSMNEIMDVHAPKQTRSPSANDVFHDNTHFAQKESKRHSFSPPRLDTRSSVLFSTSDSSIPQRSLPSANNSAAEAATSARTTSFSVTKRTRSPPLISADKGFEGNFHSIQDDTERERQAKAKRLARFKEELSDGFENIPDVSDQKAFVSRSDQSTVRSQNMAKDHSMFLAGDLTRANIPTHLEGQETTSSIIVGLCPDMCPESERGERERKGDLDQYERLDGDRNQTSRFLAVKKYNRTAEREANLIRPMPVLQKTIDYLLTLLDQPYDDRFLGMYNFLWDRMRAIRMDLRMQHMFNREAIAMLEQMIRLHIIAMHELCEYTKGEGFSEGFDAHLNIEQMNKTSVELFQMYDDHRKKGIDMPTEKEFRGYYALLKLDKHPGYKVEPAELSLDLAKMTPEIRQTPEVIFARDVARACRTGNFIAFFRLARKASYLQSCLMHAHFAKSRSQALASLHSGLQNYQGLPVTHVAKWLAMEEEDIESLLEYHGFPMKEFEEPYMMKDGPFLSGDKDYPTKCSKLVHLKKSRTILEDVSPPSQVALLLAEAPKEIQPAKIYRNDTKVVPSVFMDRKSPIHIIDEEMPDFEVVSSPKVDTQVQPMLKESSVDQQSQDDHVMSSASTLPRGFSLAYSSPELQSANIEVMDTPNHNSLLRVSPKRSMENMPFQIVSRTSLLERSPSGNYGNIVEKSTPLAVIVNDSKVKEPACTNLQNENDEVVENDKAEDALAKLKLIIRLWRRRSSKRRELREQRQIAANAALSSLSLGPPIRQNKDQPSTASEFDIDRIMRERCEKHERSWSRLNVSDVVANILCRRNPHAKCLSWKIISCSQVINQGHQFWQRSHSMHLAAGQWLFSKLMPSRQDEDDDDDDDDDMLVSSPGLSIWKKWIPIQSSTNLTCCLSVVKDVKFDNLNESVDGATAVLFLVSDSIPWNLQKIQLHKLLMSIPSGSSLPLLVLSGSYCKEFSDPSSIIVSELGLHDIDKSQVSSFLVVSLLGDEQKEPLDGFFSDMQLKEGLQWLANESPLQPDVHSSKTRELVLAHLNTSLDVLEKMSDYEVGPNQCISAFNEAIDWSLGEIAAAAKANPAGWPCPEIALLEDLCDEHRMVKRFFPSIGWSSAARIGPLLCAVKDCKLPSFPDAISWLHEGANIGSGIENLRSQLENCLIGYLTQSSGMMGFPLATKEAYVMLQRNARLELHNSRYYITPKWIMIFRRIFNWRLTSLSSGAFSSAYILRHPDTDPRSRILNELRFEEKVSSPYTSQPSLDEIIDLSCKSLMSTWGQPYSEAFQPPPSTVSNDDVLMAPNTSEPTEDERTTAQNGNLLVTYDVDHVTSELNTGDKQIVVGGPATKEANNLGKLLEQCNIVQDSIDKKLYFYF